MKNEWDLFADVKQRLATGEVRVRLQATTPERFRLPTKSRPLHLVDEHGTMYTLSIVFNRILNGYRKFSGAFGFSFSCGIVPQEGALYFERVGDTPIEELLSVTGPILLEKH